MNILPNIYTKAKTKELEKELGTSESAGAGVFGSYEAELDSICKERQLQEYREMLKDPTIEGLFNILTMPLLASEYSIKPEGQNDEEAKRQADFVRKNLFEAAFKGGIDTPFDLFLDQSTLALAYGFAVWEKVYKIKDGKIELQKLALRDPQTIEIKHKNGEYDGVVQTLPDGKSVFIPAHKTFLFTHNKKFNNLYGRSVFTSLRRNYDKKWKLEYLDSIALQNDAIKPKVLTEQAEHTVSGRDGNITRRIIDKMANLGKVKSSISLPYGYDIKTLDSNGRDPHQSIERQKSEMAFAFLANFMLLGAQGSSSTGSFALSDTQAGIFQLSLQSILDKLEAHINQYLIADLVALNFSQPRYPVFSFAKIDRTTMSMIYDSFRVLLDKYQVSPELVRQVEDTVATKLGLQASTKPIGQKPDASRENQNVPPSYAMSDDETVPQEMKQLHNKWQELERRFLDSSHLAAEQVAEKIASGEKTENITLPKIYRDRLLQTISQAYSEGKIYQANADGKPAPKNSAAFKKTAKAYANWIIAKQEHELREYINSLRKEYNLADNDVSDTVEKTKASVRTETIKNVIMTGIGAWFAKRAQATANYAIGKGVNAGIYAYFKPWDIVSYYSKLDSRTTAGCAYLHGKTMKWEEWQNNPDLLPPRHYNCRATLVRQDQAPVYDGQDTPKPKKPELPKIQHADYLETATKKELTKTTKLADYTKKEILTMEYYKTDEGYSAINQSLRRGEALPPKAQDAVTQLEKAIKKDVFTEDTTIYRGVSLDRKLTEGETLEDMAFMSTSTDVDVSMGFATGGYNKYNLPTRDKRHQRFAQARHRRRISI